MRQQLDLYSRARATGIHLVISAAVTLFAAILVFCIWYPGYFRSVAGGTGLFLLITGVDIVLGPLLTFAVFDTRKGWPQLRRDLVMIALIQATALAYGLHTVFAVRPIAMVFEVDRFRIVTSDGVYRPELSTALPPYRKLPLAGPWLLGTRPTQAGEERKEVIFMSLRGVDIADRPSFWRPYAESTSAILAKSRSIQALMARYPEREVELGKSLLKMHADPATARFLPVVARVDWVIVLNGQGSVLGALEAEGFF
jgi:hypothetical protein